MGELDHKESWAPKNWWFQTVVPEKTLESPLDSKKIKPVNSKGNQLWVFIGKTDAEAEVPILWPHDVTANSLEKTLILGMIEGKKRSGKQKMGWLDSIIDSVDMYLGKLQEIVKNRVAYSVQSMGLQRVGHWLNDWRTKKLKKNLKKIDMEDIIFCRKYSVEYIWTFLNVLGISNSIFYRLIRSSSCVPQKHTFQRQYQLALNYSG